MTNSLSLARSLVLVCSVLSLVACGGEDGGGEASPVGGEETEVAVSQAEIQAVIGPEGGELAAPADHALAGFKVEIPAGALAAPTPVRLIAVVDDTPLGLLAERVGPQVQVEASGATLAVPARITLPLDRGLLDAWGSPAQCAVWQRTDAGWTKLPQVSSTEDTVTIESSSLRTVAAGVAITQKTGTCSLNPSVCVTALPLGACVNPSGYCVQKLPDLSRTMMDGTASAAVVQAGFAYYLHAPAAGQLTVVRYDLGSGASVAYQGALVPSGVPLRISGRIAVEADQSVWVSTSFGNLHLRAGSQAEIFEATTGGAGVAVSGGVTTRFFSKRVTISKDGTTQDRLCSVSPAGCASVTNRFELRGVEPRPGVSSQGFLVLSSSQGAAAFSTLSTLAPLPFFGSMGPSGSSSFLVNMATSPVSGAVGLIGNIFDLEGGVLEAKASRYASPTAAAVRETVYFEGPSVAMDDDDTLFSVAGQVPEAVVIRPDGSSARVALSADPPESTAAQHLLPRAVVRIPGSTAAVLLITRGTVAGKPEFHQLVRAGG